MADIKTNSFFIPGKLSVLLDGGAGSSGKGKIGAYLVKNSHKVNFVCNTFMPQASHTVVELGSDGKEQEYVYKQLNSCAHFHEKFDKMFIGQGSVINVKALLEEIRISGIPTHKLGISPIATILQDIDTKFEEGKIGFDGEEVEEHDGTVKFGSTCSGVGAARARRVLRRPNIKLARDIEELQPYLCDVEEEIMKRLDEGKSGLLEIAQGFQLSYGLHKFYPYTTSRNCTVTAGFDDMMLPVSYLGNVCINFRTYPIRIHSYKYVTVPTEEQKKMMEQAKVLEHKQEEEKEKTTIEIPAGSPERPEVAEKVAQAQKKLTETFQVFVFQDGRRVSKTLPLVVQNSFYKLYESLNVGGGRDFVMEYKDFNIWYNSPSIQKLLEENKSSATDTFTVKNSSQGEILVVKDDRTVEFFPRHLTWDEVQEGKISYKKIESYSGDFYLDQQEITWEELTRLSGAPDLIMECTTLTKLPRRVATFSQTNLLESIRYNQTPNQIWISINFANYLDWNMNEITDSVSHKVRNWCNQMIIPVIRKFDNVSLKLLGTSKYTDHTIMLDNQPNKENILRV